MTTEDKRRRTEDGVMKHPRTRVLRRRTQSRYKPYSKISMLPEGVRTEINRRLCEGSRLHTIREWLFAQKAEHDVPDLDLKAGDCYSLVWTRASKSEEHAGRAFQQGLSNWFHTQYQAWLKEQADREESIRLIEHVEQLTNAASEKGQRGSTEGGNLLIRSLLIDAVQRICKGGDEPAEIARLANAWARMSHARTETEKLKLRTQEAIDVGLQALHDEMKDNPEAIELLRKLNDAVKGGKKPSS